MNKPEHFKIPRTKKKKINEELDRLIAKHDEQSNDIRLSTEDIKQHSQIILAYTEAKIIVNENTEEKRE